eukprot:5229577-Pleurochrysis_carterae.AAC.2
MPLQGRARSDTVVETVPFESTHASSEPGGNHLTINDTVKSGRGTDAGVVAERTCGVAPGWWRCQAVSTMRATGCCGMPELKERENKMGNHACRPKGAARCVGCEQSTRDEGKKLNNRVRDQKNKQWRSIAIFGIAPITLGEYFAK